MKPMMNDDGLLECPFCGSNEAYKDNSYGGYYVACPQCGCGTDGRFKLSLVVKLWNTRNGHLYTADDYKQDAMERANGL
jgi:hypothetical protein